MNIREYYKLVVDFWRLFRNQIDNNRWKELNTVAVEFVNQHGGTRFAKDLMLAFLNEVERNEQSRNAAAETAGSRKDRDL